MVLKRKFVVVGLAVLCFLVALFVMVPTLSSPGMREYDPWLDLNGDGIIDGSDIVVVARAFGTLGTPITKAGVLFDSGWIDITGKAGQEFNVTHNLNSTDIIVDIAGKTSTDGGVHQKHLGLTAYTPGWSRTYGGTDFDAAYSVVETRYGGYAIAGCTDSFGAGGRDAWLIKTDAAGNMQWNKTYGGTSSDYACSVVEARYGGYALAGGTGSFGAGNWDFWLVKTDVDGNMQWNKTYGATGNEGAYSVVHTGDGGYAVAGCTDSFGAGSADVWLVKTDSAGNMQWNQTYGGIDKEEAWSVVQTGDGGYALAGWTESFATGGYDLWLVRTDSAGNQLWNKTYGGIGWDIAFSVVETGDGGYALAGYTESFGAGGADVWLVKTDSAGNMQWNQTYGGTGWDVAYSMAQTSDGGYVIAGHGFWVKTDSVGNVQWNRRYVVAPFQASAYSVVQTGDGGYVLAGLTSELSGDPFASYDFWFAKTEVESGLAWADSSADTITLYRGATDQWWNYVRVRIWKIKETP